MKGVHRRGFQGRRVHYVLGWVLEGESKTHERVLGGEGRIQYEEGGRGYGENGRRVKDSLLMHGWELGMEGRRYMKRMENPG